MLSFLAAASKDKEWFDLVQKPEITPKAVTNKESDFLFVK